MSRLLYTRTEIPDYLFVLLMFPGRPTYRPCRQNVLGKKKPPTFVGGFVFALLFFLGRGAIRAPPVADEAR